MMTLYAKCCRECSRLVTQRYSTSFSIGIKAFDSSIRMPIYSIYGFVRFADEIVDTFYGYPQGELLQRFRADTYQAIKEGISLNPILHAFQEVVNKYQIDMELIEAFLDSMEMDLHQNRYEKSSYEQYIYGSAEVVGLMCLKVFCYQKTGEYERLRSSARSLGAAFQKVNFLRDIKSDFEDRARVYFPGVDFSAFTPADKQNIEKDIQKDFDDALVGIRQLPATAQFGVYVAYVYYLCLFKKIKKTSPCTIRKKRIRVSDVEKIYLLIRSLFSANGYARFLSYASSKS